MPGKTLQVSCCNGPYGRQFNSVGQLAVNPQKSLHRRWTRKDNLIKVGEVRDGLQLLKNRVVKREGEVGDFLGRHKISEGGAGQSRAGQEEIPIDVANQGDDAFLGGFRGDEDLFAFEGGGGGGADGDEVFVPRTRPVVDSRLARENDVGKERPKGEGRFEICAIDGADDGIMKGARCGIKSEV